MTYVAAGLVLAFVVLLVLGGLTGRVRPRSCCAPGDAEQDLRMRGAFEKGSAGG